MEEEEEGHSHGSALDRLFSLFAVLSKRAESSARKSLFRSLSV